MPEFFCTLQFFGKTGSAVLVLALIVVSPSSIMAEETFSFHNPPAKATEHVTPPRETRNSVMRLEDNGDGTITDRDSRLMWAQKDSYADLGICLDYTESLKYVNNLTTGGYTDWRFPTLRELVTLYDETQENVMAWDHDPRYPLALDSKFASGAAYWYWSSDVGTTSLTANCAKTLYFANGIIEFRRFELCNNGGVRAVRKTH